MWNSILGSKSSAKSILLIVLENLINLLYSCLCYWETECSDSDSWVLKNKAVICKTQKGFNFVSLRNEGTSLWHAGLWFYFLVLNFWFPIHRISRCVTSPKADYLFIYLLLVTHINFSKTSLWLQWSAFFQINIVLGIWITWFSYFKQ